MKHFICFERAWRYLETLGSVDFADSIFINLCFHIQVVIRKLCKNETVCVR